MVFWASMFWACSGHAEEPVVGPVFQADAVVLALDNGVEITADEVQLGQGEQGSAQMVRAVDGALEISAPHTDWDLSKREATLSGGVVAVRDDLRMECERMIVHFSDPGRVEWAVATGAVRVSLGGRVATGKKAKLTTANGVVVLTGSPSLSDGANHMRGERIVLWLDDQRVECEACRLQIDPSAMKKASDVDSDSP
jgi:lipopolysaccharide export system protein LptA